MIDLHTHTTESDGTFTPAELVADAIGEGLFALSITDHDTFAGYDTAVEIAAELELDLICGIELGTRMPGDEGARGRSVHMLGYFPPSGPAADFRAWLGGLQASRRDRNRRLVERLRELGLDIRMEEVEAIGRNMTGRPHFARLLVEKGYVRTHQQAFDDYLDESAKGYVIRDEPSVAEGIQRILQGGGIPVIAHPVRLARRNAAREEELITQFRDAGLLGLEAYHSDHTASDTARYLEFARKLDLLVTGGSDFHGAVKPNIRLGGVPAPNELLYRLRDRWAASA